jgi:hydrogenase/urease accessory protein HupE
VRWSWEWKLNPGVAMSVVLFVIMLSIASGLPWWGAFIAGYIAAFLRVDIEVT